MDIGETLAQSLVREVKEETGFDVRTDRIVGIYSDPSHVFAYDDGEVRQEFSICIACTIESGSLQVSSESTAVDFFTFDDISKAQLHESVRIRIRDYLDHKPPVLR
jgi:8-oxo-dGTP pyrophosphatase MutT (NUDIX family)